MASSSSEQKTKRQERRERREQLRARAIGAVGRISLDGSASASKKIVFDEDEEDYASDNNLNHLQAEEEEKDVNKEENESEVEVVSNNVAAGKDDESDDSDSDVEEVKTSSQTLELLHNQEEAAKEAAKALSKKKKKKKKKVIEAKTHSINDDGDASDLDESFFQQLQKERQENKAREAEIPKKPLNTRTTFVLEEDDSEISPIDVGNGLQVVALDAGGPSSSSDLYEATPTAVHHSKRTLIQDGADASKQHSKINPNSGPNRNQPTWERSSRMKRLFGAPNGSFGNKRRRGMAAAFFSTRK